MQSVKRLQRTRVSGQAMRHSGAADVGLYQHRYWCCWLKKLVVSVVREMVHGLRLRSVFYVLRYCPLKWICHSQHLGKEVRSGRSQLMKLFSCPRTFYRLIISIAVIQLKNRWDTELLSESVIFFSLSENCLLNQKLLRPFC